MSGGGRRSFALWTLSGVLASLMSLHAATNNAVPGKLLATRSLGRPPDFTTSPPVAPEEARPEVAALRDSFEEQADAVGKMGNGVVASLLSSALPGLHNMGVRARREVACRTTAIISFMR